MRSRQPAERRAGARACCCWKQAVATPSLYPHPARTWADAQERRMFDWGYDSEPEPALGGGASKRCAARCWAASSSINVMAFTRGDPADYDRWAQSGALRLVVCRRTSRTSNAARPSEEGESEYRGGEGPIGVEWAKTQRSAVRPPGSERRSAAGYPMIQDYNAAHT